MPTPCTAPHHRDNKAVQLPRQTYGNILPIPAVPPWHPPDIWQHTAPTIHFYCSTIPLSSGLTGQRGHRSVGVRLVSVSRELLYKYESLRVKCGSSRPQVALRCRPPPLSSYAPLPPPSSSSSSSMNQTEEGGEPHRPRPKTTCVSGEAPAANQRRAAHMT